MPSSALLLSQAFNGLALGTLLALVSSGLTIILGTLGVLNFAHGALFMVGAYAIFVISTFCSVIALKELPLSLMPAWNASSYFFVTLFAYLFMKEKPNRKKLLGLGVLFLGIVIFSLPL